MNDEDLIQKCFDEHRKDIGEIKFSFEEYRNFWVNHKPGQEYEMVNRNKSVVPCKIVYFPLPSYPDLRALIEIDMNDYKAKEILERNGMVYIDVIDYREVPVCFLKKKVL